MGTDRWVGTAVVTAVVVGVLLRIWFISSALGPFDSDEAVAGLMGRHMLDGEFFSFYWGQAYGGVHEAVLLTVLFAVRTPAWLAMEIVPMALSGVAALLTWRIGLLTFGRAGAALAGSLFWCSSAVFVWQSTKERSFYTATLVAGTAVLFLTLRLIERPTRRDALLLGVAGGVGWHSSPNIVYMAAPALLWLLIETVRKRDLTVLRMSWVAAVGAVVGALPWIYSNLASGGASLKVGEVLDTTYAFRLGAFAKRALPYALGAQTPQWEITLPSKILYAFLLAGLALAVLRLPRKAYVFVLGLAMLPFIFAALPTSWYVREPRYLYFTWPLVVLVVGGALGTLRNHSLALGVLVLIAAGSVASTAVMVERGESVKGLWDFAPGDLSPVIARLDAEGQDRVFADYWIAYRLALATDEKVIAAPLQMIRYEPYEAEVRAAENPTYVFFDGSCDEEKF
ncbi:MAG: glycosyltransferase family 39 protein, partial [Actinobacteria bacterium]|nr:glycosyltransferase family 39 protein [Actinomycetota bacterium]